MAVAYRKGVCGSNHQALTGEVLVFLLLGGGHLCVNMLSMDTSQVLLGASVFRLVI